MPLKVLFSHTTDSKEKFQHPLELTGSISSSLGNVTGIESLDLSGNKHSGEIPAELVQLTFLSVFNISNNFLTGTIPQANQFSTFHISSFAGNLGLCGTPLPNKCAVSENLPPDQDSESWFEFHWNIVFVVDAFIGKHITGRSKMTF